MPAEFAKLGNSVEAWRRRLQSGGAMSLMARDIGRLHTARALELFADWTDRIAAGELPFAKPERPKGIERNVVLTMWDWGHPTGYLHDAISTDRRDPRVNARGNIYASPEDSSDLVPELDPVKNVAREIMHPVRDPATPSSRGAPFQPSAWWGPQPIWDSKTLNHNPLDPAKDKRVHLNLYAITIAPTDGTLWGTAIGYPGQVVRVVPGADPTTTALAEVYEPPLPGFGPRGGDVDLNGVYWVALSSGHLGSFDRRKCNVLNGPTALGKHCPEGWQLHRLPGPQMRDLTDAGSAEASYYVWVDYHGILGLGKNVSIAMGNLSDSLLAFVEGKFVTLHLPYPSGLFPKNVDGRIDDPNAGWKGRAIWTTSGTRTLFHTEAGKDSPHKALKVQMRPDPLAR